MGTAAWRIGEKASRAEKRIPLAQVEEVLRLYKETYYDLNIRHFHEKLREETSDQAELHLGAKRRCRELGLVAKRHKRGPHRRRAAAASDAWDAVAHRR